jgi:hypothetical protein
MGFLGMPRSEGAAHATEARAGVQAPLALLAASCILLGILPTFVIPAIDRAVVPITHMSACAALVPPFFNVDSQRQEHLPVKFVAEFHDLGAQVGGRVARTRSRCPPSRRAKPGRVCNVDLVYGCRLCYDPCCRLHRLPIIVPPSTTQARSGLGWRVAPPLAGDNLYGSGILEPCASSSRPSSSLRRARTASKPSQSIFGRQSSGTARRFTSSTGWRSTP